MTMKRFNEGKHVTNILVCEDFVFMPSSEIYNKNPRFQDQKTKTQVN